MNDEMAIILSDLADATKKLRDATGPFYDQRPSGNSSTSTIHVNAGGAGLWIAVTCCLCMFCMMVVGAACIAVGYEALSDRVSANEAAQSKSQAYLNAIYQKAPFLKQENDHGK